LTDLLSGSSSLSVPYNIRPSKQTERRMLLDLYQTLVRAAFPIQNYHYVGFGSIFYVDFKILHKLFKVQRMTSIEGFKDIWTRCSYNLPFNNVLLHCGLSTSYFSGLQAHEQYLVWLDYDFSLNGIAAADIQSFCALARPGSLIFVTLDMERPKELADESPTSYFEYYKDELPEFAMAGLSVDDFRPPVRERNIIQLTERCFSQGILGRPGLTFEYLIRLAYADGHRMLTIGGMIADDTARENLGNSAMDTLWFLSRGESGPLVEIPKFIFTQKEIAVLEHEFPNASVVPAETGVTQLEFDEFRRFYRYWPSYSEALV